MNGSSGGWENTRSNLQPKEIPPAEYPVSAAAPYGAGCGQCLQGEGALLGHVSIAQAGARVSGGEEGLCRLPRQSG